MNTKQFHVMMVLLIIFAISFYKKDGKNNYIELDVYPFWKDYAIVEVELSNESDKVELPMELNVIREVTEEKQFKNHSLAKNTDII